MKTPFSETLSADRLEIRLSRTSSLFPALFRALDSREPREVKEARKNGGIGDSCG